MRSWTERTSSFASVVMMAHDSTTSALRVPPRVPKAREGEGCSRCQRDTHRLPPSTGALPLVEAVGEDETASARQGGAEAGLLSYRLGAHVDDRRAGGRPPRAGHQQPPAHVRPLPWAAAPYRQHRLSGRDVVPGRLRQPVRLELEPEREPFYLHDEAVSSAHAPAARGGRAARAGCSSGRFERRATRVYPSAVRRLIHRACSRGRARSCR